jgi:hypothetical protein
MPTIKYIQCNFTSGIFSKKVHGRVDQERYYNAVDSLINWIPLIQGGVTRRPGFHFVDYPRYNDKVCRLIPFEYGVTQAYVIEVGDQYMRFIKDGALIRLESGSNLVTNGDFPSALTGWTNYSVSPGTAVWDGVGTAQLDGGATGIGSIGQSITTISGKTYLLRFDVITDNIHLRVGTSAQGTQILNDVIVAPGTQRQATLIARGTTTYIQFLRKSNGPVKIDNVVCKLYDPYELTTSPYLETELPDLKWAQDSNDLYITHPNYWPRKVTRSSDTSWTITTIDNTYFIDGPYFAEQKTPTLVASAATGDITLVASAALWNTDSPSKHIGALWRLGWYYWKDSTTGFTWGCGCVRITSVEDSTHCHATVLADWPLITTYFYLPTTFQREGRWSVLRGYPITVVFHEGRLIFGGSMTSPQTFCGSVVDDPLNMSPSDNKCVITDSKAISFTIGSNRVNLIRWLLSAKGLALGTNGGMFVATSSPITPTDVNLVNQGTEGASSIQGIRIGASMIFIERSGSQVLELTYNYMSDNFDSVDLSVLADALVEDGITDMVFQHGVSPTLWFTKTNGNFLGLVYKRNEKVASWSEHNTPGIIESFAVIPSPSTKNEIIYMVVKRIINSISTRTIEYLDSYLNVDCGLSANFSTPVSTLSGLDHLVGEIVDIVGDAAVYPQVVVDENGQVEIDPPAKDIEVGLHYDCYLKTLKPEIQSTQNTIQPCKKRWSQLWVKLVDTVGITLNGEVIPFRSSLDPMDEGITPFTGDKEMFNLGWEDDGVVTIEQKLPLPATVLSIFGRLEINES